jgi:hypothetical protein
MGGSRLARARGLLNRPACPERRFCVPNLCVPYLPDSVAPETMIALADRTIYPEDKFPAAQWDY